MIEIDPETRKVLQQAAREIVGRLMTPMFRKIGKNLARGSWRRLRCPKQGGNSHQRRIWRRLVARGAEVSELS